MWNVSSRWNSAVPVPHTISTKIFLISPNADPLQLKFSSGTVTVDRTQRIRRTANLLVQGGSDLYATLTTPGTSIWVDHGFLYGHDAEYVPLLRGEISNASLSLGDGLIQITVADYWQGLAAADFLNPYTPAVNDSRATVIKNAVLDVYPGAVIENTAMNSGTVSTKQAWTSRADMIAALANDANIDAFFGPDGHFIIRDSLDPNRPADWTIKTGLGGTLISLNRTRPLDKIYNAVILTPATGDSAQQWDQVTAVITDTQNPRHPARLGRTIPYRYSSPSLLTLADATRVAGQILTRLQGSTETLSLGAVSNPALDAGDKVRVLTPIDGGNTIVDHFLDSIQLDLSTGSMSCGTRSTSEVDT